MDDNNAIEADNHAIETTENELIALRRAHLDKLRTQRSGGNAFINTFKPQNQAAKLLANYDHLSKEDLNTTNEHTSIAGRIVLKRTMGKASFLTLQDISGKLQIYVRQDALGEDEYAQFLHCDLGDIVGATGQIFKTNSGELSIKATQVVLLTKALRPLPDKHKGLTDTEIRYRQRYLDLITNPQSKQRLVSRSKIVSYIRNFFIEQDFLEVETPMLHPLPGGANARPFITHHNTLDMDLYLRIAPELYLKRLVVGGLEQIFEINRNFRNEGVSTTHNPEFTMLEFYQAYATYTDAMGMVENLLDHLANKMYQSTQIVYQQNEISFAAPFARLSMQDAVLQYNPKLSADTITNPEVLRGYLQQLDLKVEATWGWGKLVCEIFEATVEEQLIQPTFITDYPKEISPLARVSDDNPELTDRFELFIAGYEVANGFSELNDPQDQAQRFKAQQQEKTSGDNEAMYYDSDYITALEYGMPPTAGTGIGIDRLVMLLTDAASIRDVLFFPLMRSKNNVNTQ
jgi:lysyl-tRNA synthetase, class II